MGVEKKERMQGVREVEGGVLKYLRGKTT